MLALEEKVRTIALLRPEVCCNADGEAKDVEIIAKFEEKYLEVKARKQIYLTQADAGRFFHFLEGEAHTLQVEAFTRGLSTVLVLEHLDGEAIEKTIACVAELCETYGAGSIYCSQSAWETMRDLEFFFPHLDKLPTERTLAILKADGLAKGQLNGRSLEELVEDEAAAMGLFIVARREMTLKKAEAEVLCEDLKDTPDYKGTIGFLLAEPGVVAICLEGRGAVGKWQLLCGPANAGVARDRAPTTIRAGWGTDSTSNAVHASSSLEASEKELRCFFPEGTLQVQRTLCIIKPDALQELLQIRMEIEAAGFTVLKDKQITLTEERAKEFYRDRKDEPYFASLIKEACAGPCCVMVLCRLEAVKVWQQLMGPEAVKDAKGQRPKSIRARWGRDGQRNAVHGSASAKSAAREVRFFFPELGADPIPDDDEVRDFLFRKSAGASMDLTSLDANTVDTAVDPTLQQLLSRGLMALCQVQPKGLAAVKWLSRWLMENNPNESDKKQKFEPPDRDRTKRFVAYGVTQEGMTFSVEAPPPMKKKQVIEVDVSEETEENRVSDLPTPPYVIFVAGGPGSGKGTQCSRLKEDFNFVYLSTGDLMRDESSAGTYLGTEIYKHMQSGTLVPDAITLQLLKKTMLKHQDTNRFLVDGFPRSLDQAKRFEQEIAEVAFVLYFEASRDTRKERIAKRAEQAPGRIDDNPETVEKRLATFEEQTMPVVEYYGPIGKVRTVNAEKDVDEVYAEVRRYFSCRFVYLLGPPGAPVSKVASCLEKQYNYTSINVTSLLQDYANSEEKDAAKVKQELATGKPVEASIACPLVLAEIYRGMALGVNNFVLAGFPQSLKQVEFVEYRVPCISKPLLLDFTRADADDLAAASLGETIGSLEEIEMQMGVFYGTEMQDMLLKKLPGLVRVPCSLRFLENVQLGRASREGLEAQLVETIWESVREKVMPGVTLVLGLPCSGTGVLSPMLASLTPNTQAVNCSQLLDKEMERRTDLGVEMHNMLARGQVVPLSTTLQLLKGIVNLTCSDYMVLEDCPMYVDQIEYLTKEFRIDRVFHISGNDKAIVAWRDEYSESFADQDGSVFDEHAKRLELIVQYFSRMGKLDRLGVTKTPDADKLRKLVEEATTPQFAIVTGLSPKQTSEQAVALAAAYGSDTVLTVEGVVKWAETALKRTVDATKPEEFFAALQKYADGSSSSVLVLDGYPTTNEDAADFHDKFGDPKVVVNIHIDDEKLSAEFEEAHADDDPPIDQDLIPEILEKKRTAHDKMVKTFEEKCPASFMQVDGSTPANEITEKIKARLLPRVYVLVAPCGISNFSGSLADTICTSRREGLKRRKFTTIDSTRLFEHGRHSADIEDKLLKASFMAEAPDSLPANLWMALFKEAFANSANPMGTFLVTNFPTQCAMSSKPTVRDQFCMLESISAFMGILHVKLSDKAFTHFCSADPQGFAKYKTFSEAVHSQTAVQFDSHQVCEATVEDCKPGHEDEVMAKVAFTFLSFQDRLEP